MIFSRAYRGLEADLQRFLRSVGAQSALIRHDRRDEKPPYPRGGFLVPKSLLNEVLDFFFGQNRIVAVYEPVDPLLNSYNLNLLFESPVHVHAEIMGPGFDASDLQRGYLSPHEAFSITLSAEGEVSEQQRVSVVDEATYQESKQLRIRKVRQKFQESPTPELARRIYADLELPSKLDEHLVSLRSPLAKGEPYVPITQALVTNSVDNIVNSKVIGLFQEETGAGFPLNFSTSFIDNGQRQVYWDIVSPKLKFQGLK